MVDKELIETAVSTTIHNNIETFASESVKGVSSSDEQTTMATYKDVPFVICSSVSILIVLISIVVCIGSGLVLGMILFFQFEAQNKLEFLTLMTQEASSEIVGLQTNLNNALDTSLRVTSFLQVFNLNTGLTVAQFEQFITLSFSEQNQLPNISIVYCPFVNSTLQTNFTLQIQAMNGLFSNFTLKNASTIMDSYPIVYAYPYSLLHSSLGVNCANLFVEYWNEWKINPFHPMVSKVFFNDPLTQQKSIFIFRLILNSNASIHGVVMVIVPVNSILYNVGDMLQLDQFHIIHDLKERNFEQASIMFHTNNKNMDPFETTNELINYLNTIEYKTQLELTFANRKWTYFEIYSQDQIVLQRPERWIALLFSLISAMGLLFIITLVMGIIVVLYKNQRLAKNRCTILVQSQSKMNELMNSIAKQEAKKKFILDKIRDAILIVDNVSGRIVECNKSFRYLFAYELQDIANLFIYNIIPDMPQDCLQQLEEQEFENFKAISKFQLSYTVNIAITSIPVSTIQQQQQSVIIIRVLSILSQENTILISNESTLSQHGNIVELVRNCFEDHDSVIYKFFKQCCKEERNSEIMDCLDAIFDFKTTIQVQLRIKKQKAIFNTFLSRKGSKQINISEQQVKMFKYLIEQSLGDINCFKDLEIILLDMLIVNSNGRFQNTTQGQLPWKI